jgi:RNA-directed DNA polymerase
MSLNKFEPSDYGTPQGSIISHTLANLTLNGLQDQVYKSILPLTKSKEKRLYIKHADGKITRPLINLFIVRYADDFVIIARSKHILENYVKPQVCSFLEERGLTLSSEKTKIFTLKDERQTLNFLGYSFKYHRN